MPNGLEPVIPGTEYTGGRPPTPEEQERMDEFDRQRRERADEILEPAMVGGETDWWNKLLGWLPWVESYTAPIALEAMPDWSIYIDPSEIPPEKLALYDWEWYQEYGAEGERTWMVRLIPKPAEDRLAVERQVARWDLEKRMVGGVEWWFDIGFDAEGNLIAEAPREEVKTDELSQKDRLLLERQKEQDERNYQLDLAQQALRERQQQVDEQEAEWRRKQAGQLTPYQEEQLGQFQDELDFAYTKLGYETPITEYEKERLRLDEETLRLREEEGQRSYELDQRRYELDEQEFEWRKTQDGQLTAWQEEQLTLARQEIENAQQQQTWQREQAEQELAWQQERFGEEIGFDREQFAWQQEQARLAAEAEEKRYLAGLAAEPHSWLEYSMAAETVPVVQPWMPPLMLQDYPEIRIGEPIPGWPVQPTAPAVQYGGEETMPYNMPSEAQMWNQQPSGGYQAPQPAYQPTPQSVTPPTTSPTQTFREPPAGSVFWKTLPGGEKAYKLPTGGTFVTGVPSTESWASWAERQRATGRPVASTSPGGFEYESFPATTNWGQRLRSDPFLVRYIEALGSPSATAWLNAVRSGSTEEPSPWLQASIRQRPGGTSPIPSGGVPPGIGTTPSGGGVGGGIGGQGAPTGMPEGGYDLSGLAALTRPSAQYQARMGPTAYGQYGGYEQARTGIRPEELDWRLWNMAPPTGMYPGLTYRR